MSKIFSMLTKKQEKDVKHCPTPTNFYFISTDLPSTIILSLKNLISNLALFLVTLLASGEKGVSAASNIRYCNLNMTILGCFRPSPQTTVF